MFETLWKTSQKTVAALEAEICDYREQLSRQPSSAIEVFNKAQKLAKFTLINYSF